MSTLNRHQLEDTLHSPGYALIAAELKRKYIEALTVLRKVAPERLQGAQMRVDTLEEVLNLPDMLLNDEAKGDKHHA